MNHMATYNVWVGGENSWNRSYMGEVGYYPLTPEQAERWIPDAVDDIDTEAMSERLHRDWSEESDGEDDFPSRDEIENGCLGYGAYTDQIFGVSKVLEDGEEEILWVGDTGTMCHVDDVDEEDDENCPRYSMTCEEPGCRWDGETLILEPGVAYHHTFKGGWGSSIELPDDEEFDLKQLTFSILEAEGLAEIVTGFSYKGEDYFDDNSSDGKSCDWYLIAEGEYYSI